MHGIFERDAAVAVPALAEPPEQPQRQLIPLAEGAHHLLRNGLKDTDDDWTGDCDERANLVDDRTVLPVLPYFHNYSVTCSEGF